MKLNTSLTIEDGVARIVLAGEAVPETAPALNRVLADVTRSSLRELVLDVVALTHLSSSVLRCLVYAHQRLGREVRIVLVGIPGVVTETIRLSGFAGVLAAQDLVTP